MDSGLTIYKKQIWPLTFTLGPAIYIKRTSGLTHPDILHLCRQTLHSFTLICYTYSDTDGNRYWSLKWHITSQIFSLLNHSSGMLMHILFQWMK